MFDDPTAITPDDDPFAALAKQGVADLSPKPKRTSSPYDQYFEASGQKNGVDPDLLRAMTHQESTFNPRAVSPKNAQGLMQLIPATARRFGVTNPFDPAQNIEGGAKYMRFLLDRYNGDVPKALAAYNAGEGRVDQYKGIPPIAETQDYVRKITGRYKGGGYAFDPFSEIAKQGVADVSADPFAALAQQGVADVQKRPTVTPTNPTNAPVPPTTAPVTAPETPLTIQQQIQSALNPNSPKAAVLLTDPSQLGQIGGAVLNQFTPVAVPEGTLLVNQRAAWKMGMKTPDAIKQRVAKKGFNDLIGNVTDAPTDGSVPAVTAIDGQGNELHSSAVTSPQEAQDQAALNHQMYPGSTTIPTTAGEIIANRGEQPVDLTQPEATYPNKTLADLGQMMSVPNNIAGGTPSGAAETSKPPLRTAQPPATPQGKVTVSLNPSDFKVGDTSVTSDEFVRPGEVAQPRDVGKGYSDKDGIKLTYQTAPDMTEEQAFRNSLLAAGATPDLVNQAVSRVRASGQPLITNYKAGNPLDVTYGDLQAIGMDAKTDRRMEESQSRNELPNLAQPPIDAPLSTKNIADFVKEHTRIPSFGYSEAPSGLVGGAVQNVGDLAGVMAGIMKASPVYGSVNEIISNGGTTPNRARDVTAENLLDFYRDANAFSEATGAKDENGKDTIPTMLFKGAGQAPEYAAMSVLPGGLMLGIPLKNALLARAEDKPWSEVVKQGAWGIPEGALFTFLPKSVQKVMGLDGGVVKQAFRIGTEVAGIGGGIYGLETLRDPNASASDKLKNAISIGLFHLYGSTKGAIKGQVAHVVDPENGIDTYVKVEGPDKAVVVEKQKPDFTMVLPKGFKDYAAKDAEIQQGVKLDEARQTVKDALGKGETEPQQQSFAQSTEKGGLSQNNTSETPVEKPAETALEQVALNRQAESEYGTKNRLVTKERAAEAKDTLKKALQDSTRTANVGLPLDPKVLAAATRVAAYHIEAGARASADFAAKMVEEFGEAIKPHLEQIYKAVRDQYKFEGMDEKYREAKAEPTVTDIKPVIGKGVIGGEKSPAQTEPAPERGTSKIGKSIEQKAIDAGLTEGFPETAGYDKKNVQDQIDRIQKLVNDDPENARAIALGVKPVPPGISPIMMVRAFEEIADKTNDNQLRSDLANSPLVSESSIHAQEMRMMRERTPDSATALIQEIRQARAAKIQKLLRGRTVDQALADEAANISKSVVSAKRVATSRLKWNEFLDSIQC